MEMMNKQFGAQLKDPLIFKRPSALQSETQFTINLQEINSVVNAFPAPRVGGKLQRLYAQYNNPRWIARYVESAVAAPACLGKSMSAGHTRQSDIRISITWIRVGNDRPTHRRWARGVEARPVSQHTSSGTRSRLEPKLSGNLRRKNIDIVRPLGETRRAREPRSFVPPERTESSDSSTTLLCRAPPPHFHPPHRLRSGCCL